MPSGSFVDSSRSTGEVTPSRVCRENVCGALDVADCSRRRCVYSFDGMASVLFSWHLGDGNRQLAISISSSDVILLLFGGLGPDDWDKCWSKPVAWPKKTGMFV